MPNTRLLYVSATMVTVSTRKMRAKALSTMEEECESEGGGR